MYSPLHSFGSSSATLSSCTIAGGRVRAQYKRSKTSFKDFYNSGSGSHARLLGQGNRCAGNGNPRKRSHSTGLGCKAAHPGHGAPNPGPFARHQGKGSPALGTMSPRLGSGNPYPGNGSPSSGNHSPKGILNVFLSKSSFFNQKTNFYGKSYYS